MKRKIILGIVLGISILITIVFLQILRSSNTELFQYGLNKYDHVLFISTMNQSVNLNGYTFTYKHKSITTNQCRESYETEMRSFLIEHDGSNVDVSICWPPSYNNQCSSNGTSNNGLCSPPILRYNIGWFDGNKNTGVAVCNTSDCPYGDILYLVKIQ